MRGFRQPFITTHKITKIVYNILRYQVGYKESEQDYYEQQYHDRLVRNLKRESEELWFSPIQAPPMTA